MKGLKRRLAFVYFRSSPLRIPVRGRIQDERMKACVHDEKLFEGMMENDKGKPVSGIRPERCIYVFAYVLELVFFSVRGLFLPVGYDVFGIKGWTVLYAVHMLASLAVMLIWTEKFRALLRTSALVMLLGFVPYIFLPQGRTRFLCGLLGYAGLGGAVTGARCGYAFAANNEERFLGILFVFFSVMLARLAKALGANGIIITYILPLTLLLLLFFCLIRFREEDFEVKQEETEEDTKGLYWAFAYFVIYFAVDGYIGELSDSACQSDYLFVIMGMAFAGILLISVLRRLALNTWHLWNLFFFSSIGMGLFAFIAPKIGTLKPMNFFCGLTYIGWPLCIYTMGCAQRRYASYRLLKRCTLVYVILAPVTTLSSDWAAGFIPEYLPLVTLCFTLALTIGMLLVSPFSYQYLFTSLWLSDIYRTDMTILKEKVEETDRFGGYRLTPRQKEIALLLLAAKTRRQIAGELGLSESTVKMHTAELYKRLHINSRVELFRMFGAAGDSEQEGPEETSG